MKLCTSDRSTIHQFKFCKGLCLNICIRPWSRRLTAPDLKLHILNLNSHQKKVYFANDDILQVVPDSFELNKTT